MHRTIFGQTNLSFAGRFRQPGERVTVDRGHHEFEGAAPETILPGLEKLFVDIIQQNTHAPTKRLLANQVAALFERFFTIHPFLDGNGRVARLLARWLVLDIGQFDLLTFPKNRRARMRYLNGLRYAHRRRDDT